MGDAAGSSGTENPYRAPDVRHPEGGGTPGRGRIWFVRLLGLALIAVAIGELRSAFSAFRFGLEELEELSDPDFLIIYANPHLKAQSDAVWALAHFLQSPIEAISGLVGLAAGVGLWGARRWARWAGLAVTGLALLDVALRALPHRLLHGRTPSEAGAWAIFALILGTLVGLLWSSGFAPLFDGRRGTGTRAVPP